MKSALEKEAASTAAAVRLPVERPTGMVWAVVLISLGSLLGLFVRLTALPLTTESVPWIALHVASIVVAWGLWHLKRWAYWCLLAAVAVGMGQNLWRLLVTPETFGVMYPMLRLAMLGFWGWYSWRSHVRQAFGYHQVERQVV